MTRARHLRWSLLGLCLGVGYTWGQAPPAPAPEQTLFVAEQITFSPGYPVGDIAIANPGIADFRVLNGRRELLLLGKTEGRTTLTLWDQTGVRRNDILIRVTTHEAMTIERDLRELLKDFPSVRVAPLGGAVVIAGEVSSERDLQSIQSIGEAAGVKSIVRYVPPSPTPTPASESEKTPRSAKEETNAAPPPPAPEPGPSGAAPTGAARYSAVEYEIQILETSIAFSSASYGQGVQPAGKVLISRKVQAPFDSPLQVDIMDPVLVEKLKMNKGDGPKGLHLRFTPSVPDEQGLFSTNLELETNLPYESKAYDPAIWRRARWQIPSIMGEPFGIAGADLLAVMQQDRELGSVWRTLQNTAGMASGFGVPGTNYATAYYYDPSKKTQLLMLIRPRLLPRTAG